MRFYRGISNLEFEAIRSSRLVQSTDQRWSKDATYCIHQRRTFFARERDQADLFAIGAYISGYGAVGALVQDYVTSSSIEKTYLAYTLEVEIPEALMRADTEFAAYGDDELYTLQSIPSEWIRHVYCHRIQLCGVSGKRLSISSHSQELAESIHGVGPVNFSTQLRGSGVERKFWLDVTREGSTVCLAALSDSKILYLA